MGAIEQQLSVDQTVTIDLSSSESVTLVRPSAFQTEKWTKNGDAIGNDDVKDLSPTPGQQAEFVVADNGSKAKAVVRWRPDRPTDVSLNAFRGGADVSWRSVSEERRLTYYEVDFTPRPSIAQLPRRTLGKGRRPRTRSLSIRGLPPDFYIATVSAVVRYDSGTVSSPSSSSKEAEVTEDRGGFATWIRVFLVLAALAGFVAGIVLLFAGPLKVKQGRVILDWWAVSIGASIVVGGLLLLAAVRRPSTLLAGVDGRVSTSRTNVALWTVTTAFALVTLTAIAVGSERHGTDQPCGDSRAKAPWVCVDGKAKSTADLGLDDSFRNGLAPQYLALLGTPFLGLAGAAFLVNRQVEQGDRQKVENLGPSRFTDSLTNDSGDGDLVDAQYLLFTVVLLFFFYATFLQDPYELPELPWGLVGLTGLSAGAYLLNKQVTTNGLTVDGFVPTTLRAGSSEKLRILGRNFMPEGSAGVPNGGVAVTIGSRPAPILEVSNSEIIVTVPAGLEGGNHEVVVTTAANVLGSAGLLHLSSA